jgi:hypothetical protein
MNRRCLTTLALAIAIGAQSFAAGINGLSDLCNVGTSISTAALNDPNIEIISLAAPWYVVQTADAGTTSDWNFTYFANGPHTGQIQRAVAAGKRVIVGIVTQNGFQGGPSGAQGNTTRAIAPAMGVDPDDVAATPGVTYLNNEGLVFCVFYNSTWIAKKSRLIKALSDFLFGTYGGTICTQSNLTTAEQNAIVGLRINAFNSQTEDWNVPHSQGGGHPNEVERWTNSTGSGGAAYTTQKMYDSVIKADNTGLLDVAMAAFPSRIMIGIPLGGNGSGAGSLDYAQGITWGDIACSPVISGNCGTWVLARKIALDAVVKYPGRFIGACNYATAHLQAANVEVQQYLRDGGNFAGIQAVSKIQGDPDWGMCNGNNTNEDPDNPGVFMTPDDCGRKYFLKTATLGNTYNEYYDSDISGLPRTTTYGWSLFHRAVTPGAVKLRFK